MRRLIFVPVLLALSTPSRAEEPTVTLTRAELEAIVAMQLAQVQAAAALGKVERAFAPKPIPQAAPPNAAQGSGPR